MLTEIYRDTLYGIRGLLQRPGFAAVALITLALGIGTNTAIFSVVNAVLLRPLPYPNEDRIVRIDEINKSGVMGISPFRRRSRRPRRPERCGR